MGFLGTFDGGYHKISNVRVDQPGLRGIGLFSTLGEGGAVIRRLAVVDSYFRAAGALGPIVGSMANESLVEECYSRCNEVIGASTGDQSIGGITGGESFQTPSAIVRNCFARDNTLSSLFQTVGGITGYNDARVEYCFTAGSTFTAPRFVGGIAGYEYSSSASIVDSYSDATNAPSNQVGRPSGSWVNSLVASPTTSNFDLTPYSIANLKWDTRVWAKGADGYPYLIGFPPAAVVCTTDLAELWPPNTKMREVQVTVRFLSESCNFSSETITAYVSSSEPDSTVGTPPKATGDVNGEDGYTAPVPIELSLNAASGDFVGSVELRAERDGTGSGRVYSIVPQDISGGLSTAICEIRVPLYKTK